MTTTLIPEKWEANQIAGLEWTRKYRERNAQLSLRKPENTTRVGELIFQLFLLPRIYNRLDPVKRVVSLYLTESIGGLGSQRRNYKFYVFELKMPYCSRYRLLFVTQR